MSSSAENIAGKEFDLKFRGYDPDRVQEFLRGLAHAQGQTIQENNALRERLILYGKKIQEYQQMDGKLRDAVISAQKIGEEIKEKSSLEAQEMLANAMEQAKNLREEAEEEATRIRAGLEEDRARLTAEIDGLAATKARVVTEIQELLSRYLEEIGVMARNLPQRPAAAVAPVSPPAALPATGSVQTVEEVPEEDEKEALACAAPPDDNDIQAVPEEPTFWSPGVNLTSLSLEVEALSRPPAKTAVTGIGAGLFDAAEDDAEELRLEADTDDDALPGMLDSQEDVQAIDAAAAGLAEELASMADVDDNVGEGKMESLFGDDMDSLFAPDDGAKKAAGAKSRNA